MMEKKILFLTLKRMYFNAIAIGWKKTEQRKNNDYWHKRLMKRGGCFKKFDEIHFRNGYRKTDPFMIVEWKGITLVGDVFYIQLGKVIKIENWTNY
jgi:hypothetical protein